MTIKLTAGEIKELEKVGTSQRGKGGFQSYLVGLQWRMDSDNIKRWSHTNGADRRCRGNTWFIPYNTIHDRAGQRPHPATFPKELPKMCIRLHGWKPQLVMLDPFLGIGISLWPRWSPALGDLSALKSTTNIST